MKKRLFRGILTLTLIASLSGNLMADALAATFTDVPEGHWAYPYVERAVANGLVNGYGDGRFGVGDNVKDSEWSKMIVGLLFADEYEQLIAESGSTGPWWLPWVTVAYNKGALNNTTVITRLSYATGWTEEMVSSPISRYDMAQTIYNIAVSLEWKAEAAEDITDSVADWPSVPERYREAVKYCYASDFITGIDSQGTFDGSASMTRGQAATVLCRLIDAVSGPNADNPAKTSVVDRLTVELATSWYTTGYKYEITVSGSAIAGKLANGKIITDENILAILAELEIIFPEDTSWGAKGSGDDPYYYGSENPVSKGGGCNGFAGMVCDLLYGHGADYTSHSDLSKVKCGDIVHLYNSSTGSEHWIVVTGTSYDSEGFMKLSACEGNVNGRLVWEFPRYVGDTEYLYPNSTIYSFY